MNNLFNPHDNNWLINKFEIYKTLRGLDKAYYSEEHQAYVITRYRDVLRCLKDPSTFSSSKGNLVVEDPSRFNRTLGASDNPIHEIYKNIVKDAYSKDNITRIDNSFRFKLKELFQRADKICTDLSEVVNISSAWATAEILNLPVDKEKITNLILDIQYRSSRAVRFDTSDDSYEEFTNLIASTMLDRVAPHGPGIYSAYQKNAREGLENYKALGILPMSNGTKPKLMFMSLFTGPVTSGASSLTGANQFLALDLYRQNKVKEVNSDRSLIPRAVSEALRFHASTGRFTRTVLQSTIVHGIELQPGDRVILSYESANRDPEFFKDPDVFDFNRDTSGHLAFGYGMHACIASVISKTLMSTFLEELLEYYGDYEVLTKTEDLKYVMTASGNDDMVTNLFISTNNKYS